MAGNPVQEGEMYGPVCIWEKEDATERSQLQVSLAFLPAAPDVGVSADQLCNSGVTVLGTPEPVDGFGDSSYWDYNESGLGGTGLLVVCLATGVMQVMAIGERPESELWQVVTEMATIALGRL